MNELLPRQFVAVGRRMLNPRDSGFAGHGVIRNSGEIIENFNSHRFTRLSRLLHPVTKGFPNVTSNIHAAASSAP